jgi:hypothetical protein
LTMLNVAFLCKGKKESIIPLKLRSYMLHKNWRSIRLLQISKSKPTFLHSLELTEQHERFLNEFFFCDKN